MKHEIAGEGGLEITKKTMDATNRLMDGISSIPGLHVIGKPVVTVFSFGYYFSFHSWWRACHQEPFILVHPFTGSGKTRSSKVQAWRAMHR
ncbi:hypothetical protein GF325_01275 [Candidatus Bathyarchaeota archaeon]|nr:hypothetical protein [Candidatus Bathyarchaeota archaeon]